MLCLSHRARGSRKLTPGYCSPRVKSDTVQPRTALLVWPPETVRCEYARNYQFPFQADRKETRRWRIDCSVLAYKNCVAESILSWTVTFSLLRAEYPIDSASVGNVDYSDTLHRLKRINLGNDSHPLTRTWKAVKMPSIDSFPRSSKWV